MGSTDLSDDWTRRAACRGSDTAAFFPENGAGPATTAAARAACAACPVAAPCLATALRSALNEDSGIWGGTSPRQRADLRRLLAEDAPEKWGYLTGPAEHPAGTDLAPEPLPQPVPNYSPLDALDHLEEA